MTGRGFRRSRPWLCGHKAPPKNIGLTVWFRLIDSRADRLIDAADRLKRLGSDFRLLGFGGKLGRGPYRKTKPIHPANVAPGERP